MKGSSVSRLGIFFAAAEQGLCGDLLTSQHTRREIPCLPIAGKDAKVAQDRNLERLLCKINSIAHFERRRVEPHHITAEGPGNSAHSLGGIEDELPYELGR